MMSVSAILKTMTRPSLRELRGGERFIPLSAVDEKAGKCLAKVLKVFLIDVKKTRTGSFIGHVTPGVVKARHSTATRRLSKHSRDPSLRTPSTPSAVVDKEEDWNKISKRSSEKKPSKPSLRSGKPPSKSKSETKEPSKRAPLRSAPISLRSEPSPLKVKSETRNRDGGSSSSKLEDRSPVRSSRESGKSDALQQVKKRKSMSYREGDEKPKKSSRRDNIGEESQSKKPRSSSGRDDEITPRKPLRDTRESSGKDSSSSRPPTSTPRGEGSSSRNSDVRKSDSKYPRLTSALPASLRSSPAVTNNADSAKQSSHGAPGNSLVNLRRRLGGIKELSSRFMTLKNQVKALWDTKDYDRYEAVSREAVVTCFDWALAREEDLRKRESEIRHSPEKVQILKNEIREHYMYMRKKFVQQRLDELSSINRKSLVPFLQRVIGRVYFRMFLLGRLWGDDQEKTALSLKQKVENAIASDKVEGSLTVNDLKRMRTILTEFSNLLCITDGITADNGNGVQEPGSEGYVQ